MKKCKYCGTDIYEQPDYDGTYKESYCDKLHRKDHERQLIKEGKMPGLVRVSGFGVLVDSKITDANGEQIYFPKVGKHFDRALQKTFYSKKEKAQYMKDNKLVMDGSSEQSHKPIESGDYRFKYE